MKKYKLVCFDLDGTLVDNTNSIWQTIHDALGVAHHTKPAYDAYFRNEISYDQWIDHDIVIWKKHGLTKQKFLEFVKHVCLMPGALETIKSLKKQGYKLAIISDSIDTVLEKCLPNYKDFFDEVFMNKMLFDAEGMIIGYTATKHGMEKKALGIKAICAKEGITPEKCVFIGDQTNDVEAAKLAGLSIAFNCTSDKLREVVDHVVEKKDLREILKILE